MTQEQRRLETKNKIFSAARKLLKSGDIDKIGVDDICRQAGVTKGAFYHHFSSKQQLLLELLDHWIDMVASRVDPEKLKQENALILILQITDAIKPAFSSSRGQLPVFVELYIKGLRDADLKKINQKTYHKFLVFFENIAKQGISQGTIQADDAQDVSKILFSLTMGFLLQGLLNPRGADWAELTKKSIRMLLK